MMRSLLTQGRRFSVASRRHFCSNGRLDNLDYDLSKIPVKAIIFRHCFDRFIATSAGYMIGFTFIGHRAKKMEKKWQEKEAKRERKRKEREARSNVSY